jgi:hypothetical protein
MQMTTTQVGTYAVSLEHWSYVAKHLPQLAMLALTAGTLVRQTNNGDPDLKAWHPVPVWSHSWHVGL